MPAPFALAAPAAIASLAYLNAKTQFTQDFSLLYSLFYITRRIASLERKDRLNQFYLLEDQATSKNTANCTFLVYQGKSWTYREVYDTVLKYAAWLRTNYGVASREIVAMDFTNSPTFIFIWLAIWSLGATPAFINYNLAGNALLHCIKTSTARIVFVDEEVKHTFSSDVTEALSSSSIREGKGPVEVVYLSPETECQILEGNALREPDASRSGAMGPNMGILIYTSGTTGLPKAAIVSWAKLYSGISFLSNWMGWKKEDRFYTCMPLYHGTAAILGFTPCLGIGSTFIIGHRFSNRTFWPEVRASKATIIQYVGETCRYLLTAPPQVDPTTGNDLDKSNDVRIAFGNGLRGDIWEKFKKRFDIETIAEFYSATEGASAAWNISSNDFSPGAIGKSGSLLSFIYRTRKIIIEMDWETDTPFRDPKRKNLCKRVVPNTPGELLFAVDPANVKASFQGYFNNEEASTSKVMRDVLKKGDAYFRTGDVARQDSEGRLWFCDRIGDTFRWKSENVSTFEVSEVLGLHPAILDANVYGVAVSGHEGRAGCVAAMFNKDVDELLLRDVAQHVSAQLPKYAVPLFLRVTKKMSVTGTNKQQKTILRQEGADPAKMDGDEIYWLRDGTYVRFGQAEWDSIKAGKVRL